MITTETFEHGLADCCCGETDRTWQLCPYHGTGTAYDNLRLEKEREEKKKSKMITTDNTKTLENALAEVDRLSAENLILRNSERRRFSAMIFAARLSAPAIGYSEVEIARRSIKFADRLIEELNKAQ